MNLPSELRAYIFKTNDTLENCASEIDFLEQEKKTLHARVIGLEKIALQRENVVQGYLASVPNRQEIGGLEASIECLDEQIEGQEKIISQTNVQRVLRVTQYLSKHDSIYKSLLEKCKDLSIRSRYARALCKDFIVNLNTASTRVCRAQHVAFVQGQSGTPVVNSDEVRKGIERANIEIGVFNEEFDYDLVLSKGVRLSMVLVPYDGASINYLQAAKRKIILRRNIAQRFHDEFVERIPRIFDAAAEYVNDIMERAVALDHPYRS